MIDEHMSQKVEINDTSKEHVARNDMKEIANKTWKLCITEIDVPMVFDSKFKTWTDKCKNHIAAALEVAEQRGMDKVLSRVPSEDELDEFFCRSHEEEFLNQGARPWEVFRQLLIADLAKLKEPT